MNYRQLVNYIADKHGFKTRVAPDGDINILITREEALRDLKRELMAKGFQCHILTFEDPSPISEYPSLHIHPPARIDPESNVGRKQEWSLTVPGTDEPEEVVRTLGLGIPLTLADAKSLLKRSETDFNPKITASKLNLKYDGFQEGIGHQFTDLETGSTFHGNSEKETTNNLKELKANYKKSRGY